jgi:ribulose-phosphate 3-epimerase
LATLIQDRTLIVPSMLDADFSRLGDEVAELDRAGADRLHWDVMDGHFVPRLTHGADILRSVRTSAATPFEAHLMIDHPEAVWERFVEAGAELIIVHVETTRHLHLLLNDIRRSGARAGAAVDPGTPLSMIENIVDLLDLLLVMTVEPGRGGQAFIGTMVDKVAAARRLLDERGSRAKLEVDGGVSAATAAGLVRAGATTLVMGSAIHRNPEGRAAAVNELRRVVQTAVTPATAERR